MITIEYDPDYIEQQLEIYHARISDWDQNFLMDIAYLIRQERKLSPKQRAHLGQLMNKIKFWQNHT